MIRISLALDASGDVKHLLVEGHSGSAEKGKDIVCAAVSAVVIGAVNCLDDGEGNYGITVEEGLVEVSVSPDRSSHDRVVLEVCRRELSNLADTYPEYIQYQEERSL